MADFEIEFQEIHRRCRQTISALSMDDAWDKADGMLPEIVRKHGWLKDHAFVSRIRLASAVAPTERT